MKVLVIPDIHLKPWIFDRAEKIIKDGKADRAVCLMDIPDDWNMEILSGAMAIMMSVTRGEGLRPDILLMPRGRSYQSSKNLRTALRVRHRST